MLESEVDHLAQTEALLYLIGSRTIRQVRSVIAAAALQCGTLTLEWMDLTLDKRDERHVKVFRTVVAQSILDDQRLPYDRVAMGVSMVGELRRLFDPDSIAERCAIALVSDHPPVMPDLPDVAPLTSTRIEYGLDAANDRSITPQLRARIVARSFGLRPWLPVALPDREYHQEFIEWVGDGSAIKRALQSVASGSVASMPEAIVASMVSGFRQDELLDLIETDERILRAFACAASDPESLTLTIRKGMAKMLRLSLGCTIPKAQSLIDDWASGRTVDPEVARLCTQYREALEIAQTYRTIAA